MKLRNLIPKKKSKKAAMVDILVWLALSFTIVLFFGIWVYGFNIMTETLIGIENTTGTINVSISDAAQSTFGKINPAQTAGLHTLAFVMIFISGLSILITNFLVKANPAFFIVYLFVIIAAIIASVYISNQYEELMTDPILGDTLTAFTGASFIMLFLPLWTTIIGIFGAIFLFAGILRDAGAGGSVV